MNAIDHSAMSDSARLQHFEDERSQELLASGLSQDAAARFARGEAEARARAALIYGIEQALAAELEMLTKPGRNEPFFRLVFEPTV